MSSMLTIDNHTCIGCGECAMDCPFGLISLVEGLPTMDWERESHCIQCQHCMATCPTGALSIHGINPMNSQVLSSGLPNKDQLALLMKGRRSIRRYQKEPVAQAQIQFLMKTIAYAPTGINNRQVRYTLIDNQQVMDAFRNETYTALQAKMANGLPPAMAHLEESIRQHMETGRDTIFRGAPHFLIASAPKNSPSPEIDCHIGLTYFELLAASMGLGTVWAGLAKWALTALAPEILTRLDIPDSHVVGYMMAFGKPAVSYYRTVQRENTSVCRVTSL